MRAYVLLAAVAWAVASRGGTSLRDLLVVLCLLACASIVGKVRPFLGVPITVALGALMTWLVATGLLRVGASVEALRMPLLVAITVLTVRLATSLERWERERFLAGVAALGSLHAAIALGELAVAVSQGLSGPVRADSLLGSPNGLGMMLVSTSVITWYAYSKRGGWVLGLALPLQGVALLATGSRTAVGVAAVLLVWLASSRPGWQLKALAAGVLVTGSALVAWRFASEPLEQRPSLWREAVVRIIESPLTGEGPASAPFSPSVPDARVTTHAHNELLQWGVEYGLVGVVLGLLVLWLAILQLHPPHRCDGWVLVAASALLAAGMVDFILRITALAVLAAALASLGLTSPSASPSRSTRSHPQTTSGLRSKGLHDWALRSPVPAVLVRPARSTGSLCDEPRSPT